MAEKRLFVSYITAAGSVCDLGWVEIFSSVLSPFRQTRRNVAAQSG